jgi:hypothetical protein
MTVFVRGSRAAMALVLALGCAQIFAIDEACVVGQDGCSDPLAPPPSDACSSDVSGSADAGSDAECARYCDRIRQKCSATPQYDDDRCECQRLCPHLPRASLATSGNSLECRIDKLDLMSGEASDCIAAGRMGGGFCGSSCDVYCSLMQSLCPRHYGELDAGGADADQVACLSQCSSLEDRGSFDPSPLGPDAKDTTVATRQCRLWHLGAAAIELELLGPDNLHCNHAVGDGECLPAVVP